MKSMVALKFCNSLSGFDITQTYCTFLLLFVLHIFYELILVFFRQASNSLRNMTVLRLSYPSVMFHDMKVRIGVPLCLCSHNLFTDSVEYVNTIIFQAISQWILLIHSHHFIGHIDPLQLLYLVLYLRGVRKIIKIRFQ